MTKTRKRRRKKEGRIPKDPVSADLRSREYARSFVSPINESGEYGGHRFEDIRLRVVRAYRDAIRSGLRVDYMDMVNSILDELGFVPERWERGAVYSALSRYHHARRKEKRAAIKARKIEEARQFELSHLLPPED